jgi:hypothetical protein
MRTASFRDEIVCSAQVLKYASRNTGPFAPQLQECTLVQGAQVVLPESVFGYANHSRQEPARVYPLGLRQG